MDELFYHIFKLSFPTGILDPNEPSKAKDSDESSTCARFLIYLCFCSRFYSILFLMMTILLIQDNQQRLFNKYVREKVEQRLGKEFLLLHEIQEIDHGIMEAIKS